MGKIDHLKVRHCLNDTRRFRALARVSARALARDRNRRVNT